MTRRIYVQLEGVETLAWATEMYNRNHNMYRVLFNNGYENIFFTDVETGQWIEDDLGFTVLAQKVGLKIKHFMNYPIHVPKLLIWHKQLIDGKLLFFGFFNFMTGNKRFYQIYNSNKKFMYTLVDMENEEWQILGHPSFINIQINSSFVEKVVQILPNYTENAL